MKFVISACGLGFPGGADGQESAYNVGDLCSTPGWWRSPGEGKGYPLQYSGLENSRDRGAWRLQSMGPQRVRHDLQTFTSTCEQEGIVVGQGEFRVSLQIIFPTFQILNQVCWWIDYKCFLDVFFSMIFHFLLNSDQIWSQQNCM